jgi:hypothetical protein
MRNGSYIKDVIFLAACAPLKVSTAVIVGKKSSLTVIDEHMQQLSEMENKLNGWEE